MSTKSASKQTPQTAASERAAMPLPPLEHGDTLTRDEFERRYHAMPELKKAELIEGRVYLPSPRRGKTNGQLPPLENGDTLTRDEFERRYHAMPDVKKAELIEGRVYMPSPVRWKSHGKPDNTLAGWLFVYRVATPGVSAGSNATVRLEQTNEPQPDSALRIDEAYGGQSFVNADDYLEGAPELVVEIAASSAAYDLGDKLAAYRRNGAREYIVWTVFEQEVHWFSFEAGAEVRLQPDEDGIVRSRVFPGLWLNVPALLQDDLAGVLSTLQQGLAAPAHGEFVANLRASLK